MSQLRENELTAWSHGAAQRGKALLSFPQAKSILGSSSRHLRHQSQPTLLGLVPGKKFLPYYVRLQYQ